MFGAQSIAMEQSKSGLDFVDSFSTDAGELDKTKLLLSPNENIIGNFQIDVTSPIPDYSTDLVQAYQVKHLSALEGVAAESAEDFYGLVFNKSYPFRLYEILALRNYAGDHLITPITYGVTQITTSNNELFFCCVMRKGKGKSLKSLMSAGIKFDENFIATKLLRPILDTLNHLHQGGTIHGAINPENIYIDEAGVITLSECISDTPGFSQQAFFETPERAQAQSWGKGHGDEKVDYYALGMTIFALLSGKDFQSYDEKEIVRLKLHQGTFDFLISNYNLSGKVSDLIRGLVIDDSNLRWTYTDIDMFMQGKSYSVNTLIDPAYQTRAIIFNGKEFYSRRSLAHEFAQSWDLAKEFIQTDKLKKWLELSTQDEKFSELFSSFMLNYSALKQGGQKVFAADDEKLARTIILLDPEGPVRIKNVSFHKSGFGPLLLSSINNGQSEVTQVLAGSLFSNLFSVYEYMGDYIPGKSYTADLVQLHKCADLIKRAELGFGVERCVYELNPTLVCQSHILKHDFCFSVRDTLEYLNEHHVSFDEMVSKKNLACYLAAKAHINHENKLKDTTQFSGIQKSRAFQLAHILGNAQKTSRINRLDNIVAALRDALKEVLDLNLRSNAIKREFANALSASTKSGSIADLLKAATNSDLLEKDLDGYSKALRRGAEITYEIFSYNNRSAMEFDIRRKSLRIAVRFSYIVCSFILITILLQSF